MNGTNLQSIAAQLDAAAVNRTPVDPIHPRYPYSVEEAYLVQRDSIGLRRARGEQTVGIKLGFTSRAKMAQMGVDSLIWGLLTDAMILEEGAAVDLENFIHPRVEPEVCFITRKCIDHPLTLMEAAEYVDGVAPAMEIIDSRFRNFKFNLQDVIADNCSSAGFVVGPISPLRDDLPNLGVVMRMDGRVVQIGSTGAILGNPLRSVVQASILSCAVQMALPAGSFIMAGGATAAEPLVPGRFVSTEVSRLGRVEFTTGDGNGK